MNAKHTPGPWRVVDARASGDTDSAPHYIIERRDSGFKSQVARVRHEPAREHGGTLEANARLIAAAPELLEALEAMAALIEDGKAMFRNEGRKDAINALAAANEAIAKAKGEA